MNLRDVVRAMRVHRALNSIRRAVRRTRDRDQRHVMDAVQSVLDVLPSIDTEDREARPEPLEPRHRLLLLTTWPAIAAWHAFSFRFPTDVGRLPQLALGVHLGADRKSVV